MNPTFINIHTHKSHPAADQIEILNVVLGRDPVTENLFTCGIHPWYINEHKTEEHFSELQKIVVSETCIAIGECGLDKLKGASPELQEIVFRRQIKLATQVHKPLIIHCVKRFTEVADCLRSESFSGYFVLHGFNAKAGNADSFLAMPNAYFSFGAALLKPGSNAEELFRKLPIEKCFLETDDSESDIKNIYLRAAEIKGLELNKFSEQLFQNYEKVFGYGPDRKR